MASNTHQKPFNKADPCISKYRLFPTIDRRLLFGDGYFSDCFLHTYLDESEIGNVVEWERCPFKDSHANYFKPQNLRLGNLPKAIRDPSVLQWIKRCIPLVVRLQVIHYGADGQIEQVAPGTGRLVVFRKIVGNTSDCSIDNCPHSTLGNQHCVYHGLGIITCQHVVETDNQAKETTVRFFFDDDMNTKHVEEKGRQVVITELNVDYTLFTLDSHRQDLVKHIEFCTSQLDLAWRNIPENIRNELKEYAIVISHPHGYSKRISIGRIVYRVEEDTTYSKNQTLLNDLFEFCERQHTAETCETDYDSLDRFTFYYKYASKIRGVDWKLSAISIHYDEAATCNGSSGAPVLSGNVFKNDNGVEVNSFWTHKGRVHNSKNYRLCLDFCEGLGLFFQSKIQHCINYTLSESLPPLPDYALIP